MKASTQKVVDYINRVGVAAAAKALDISRPTVYNRLKNPKNITLDDYEKVMAMPENTTTDNMIVTTEQESGHVEMANDPSEEEIITPEEMDAIEKANPPGVKYSDAYPETTVGNKFLGGTDVQVISKGARQLSGSVTDILFGFQERLEKLEDFARTIQAKNLVSVESARPSVAPALAEIQRQQAMQPAPEPLKVTSSEIPPDMAWNTPMMPRQVVVQQP